MRLRSTAAALLLAACFVPSARALDLGAQAPDFSLVDQTGKTVKLSDYVGKIVVLEWFNDGCPFVRKHYTTGAMNGVASKYAAKGVVWLAVNSTSSASVQSNARAAMKFKMDRPVLDDHAGTVGHAYGATNTPDMFVIDGTGKLIYKGAIDSVPSPDPDTISGATNFVAQAIDQTLSGKSVTAGETKPYGCTVKYAE